MFRRLFSLGRSGKETTDHNQYGIDLDCNYCPKCEDAYRAEIETCPACSIALIPGSEKLAVLRQQEKGLPSRSMEISVTDELVTLQTGKLVNLKPVQQLLKAEYIPSMLAGDNISKGWGGPDLQLKVKVLDAQRALEIIRKNYIKSTGLSSEDFPAEEAVFSLEAETVICPACSMRFKPTSNSCPDCGLQLGW